MTVEAISPTVTNVYTGVGDYDFPFKVYNTDEVKVYHLTPAGVLVQLTSGFTTALNTLTDGGVVTITDGGLSGGFLVLKRILPFTQDNNLVNSGPLNMETLEASLDKNVMLLQQMNDQLSESTAVSNWKDTWLTNTAYNVKDTVKGPNGNWYYCTGSHVSGVFNTDLTAGLWLLAIDVLAINSAAAAAAQALLTQYIPDPSTGLTEQAIMVNPTKTGYVLGDAGGGLKWQYFSTNQTAAKSKGVAMDTTGGVKTVTPLVSPNVGDSFGVADWKSNFHVNACKIAFTGIKVHGVVQTEDMTLDIKNQRVVFSWSGATDGYIITEATPLGNSFEYLPYAVMHVREQQNSGVGAGNSASGDNDRALNYAVQNDIAGASLAGGLVSLPAGDYQVDGYAMTGYLTTTDVSRLYLKDASGNVLLRGPGSQTGYVIANSVKGKISLPAPTSVKLSHYINQVATNGLGLPVSQGIEVYSELIITKIGGNYAPKPVLNSTRLQQMAGLGSRTMRTGFEITVTGANQLTVGKGTCLSEDLGHAIAVSAPTVLNLDTTNNKKFFIFAVHVIATDTYTCRSYDTFAAPTSDATIDWFTPIDMWQNTGAGALRAGWMRDGYHWWTKASENAVNSKVAVPANCNTAIDCSGFLPDPSMYSHVLPGGQSSSANQSICVGYDGTNVHQSFVVNYVTNGDNDTDAWSSIGYGQPLFMPCSGTIYWGRGSSAANGNTDIRLHAWKLTGW